MDPIHSLPSTHTLYDMGLYSPDATPGRNQNKKTLRPNNYNNNKHDKPTKNSLNDDDDARDTHICDDAMIRVRVIFLFLSFV